MFKEQHKQFKVVAAACDWKDWLKVVNLATLLYGQLIGVYAYFWTCTNQQRSSYSELIAALATKAYCCQNTTSAKETIPQSHKPQAKEKASKYVQGLSRFYQMVILRCYNEQNRDHGQNSGGIPVYSRIAEDIYAKIVGRKGTFMQLWVKTR